MRWHLILNNTVIHCYISKKEKNIVADALNRLLMETETDISVPPVPSLADHYCLQDSDLSDEIYRYYVKIYKLSN
jgi:hypothetical protein